MKVCRGQAMKIIEISRAVGYNSRFVGKSVKSTSTELPSKA